MEPRSWSRSGLEPTIPGPHATKCGPLTFLGQNKCLAPSPLIQFDKKLLGVARARAKHK